MKIGMFDSGRGGTTVLEAVKLAELLAQDESYDVVVLGCTHYPLVAEMIGEYYPKAQLVDGVDGVARRVEELAQKM